MADYSGFGLVKTATAAASTVDSFTMPAAGSISAVEVVHHGNTSSPVYVKVDDAISAPTVGGDGCEVVLPGERVRFARVGNGVTVVSLISTGATTVSVIGVR